MRLLTFNLLVKSDIVAPYLDQVSDPNSKTTARFVLDFESFLFKRSPKSVQTLGINQFAEDLKTGVSFQVHDPEGNPHTIIINQNTQVTVVMADSGDFTPDFETPDGIQSKVLYTNETAQGTNTVTILVSTKSGAQVDAIREILLPIFHLFLFDDQSTKAFISTDQSSIIGWDDISILLKDVESQSAPYITTSAAP